MTQNTATRRRTSPRVVLAALVLAVIGGSAVTASASTTCIGNSDSATDGPDRGVCLVVPIPTLPR